MGAFSIAITIAIAKGKTKHPNNSNNNQNLQTKTYNFENSLGHRRINANMSHLFVESIHCKQKIIDPGFISDITNHSF